MSLYFTSDLHLGHRFVAGLRGYESTDDHDERIRKEWEQVVRSGDDVWILGDLAASSPTHALEFIATLPGRKHLISGNHDNCHPMHRASHKWQRRYLEVFESVQPFARRRIAGENVMLSHFPYARDRHEARYTQYRLANEGLWLLHGHTHGTETVTIDEGAGTNEVHVGVDARGMAPVSLAEIEAEIR